MSGSVGFAAYASGGVARAMSSTPVNVDRPRHPSVFRTNAEAGPSTQRIPPQSTHIPANRNPHRKSRDKAKIKGAWSPKDVIVIDSDDEDDGPLPIRKMSKGHSRPADGSRMRITAPAAPFTSINASARPLDPRDTLAATQRSPSKPLPSSAAPRRSPTSLPAASSSYDRPSAGPSRIARPAAQDPRMPSAGPSTQPHTPSTSTVRAGLAGMGSSGAQVESMLDEDSAYGSAKRPIEISSISSEEGISPSRPASLKKPIAVGYLPNPPSRQSTPSLTAHAASRSSGAQPKTKTTRTGAFGSHVKNKDPRRQPIGRGLSRELSIQSPQKSSSANRLAPPGPSPLKPSNSFVPSVSSGRSLGSAGGSMESIGSMSEYLSQADKAPRPSQGVSRTPYNSTAAPHAEGSSSIHRSPTKSVPRTPQSVATNRTSKTPGPLPFLKPRDSYSDEDIPDLDIPVPSASKAPLAKPSTAKKEPTTPGRTKTPFNPVSPRQLKLSSKLLKSPISRRSTHKRQRSEDVDHEYQPQKRINSNNSTTSNNSASSRLPRAANRVEQGKYAVPTMEDGFERWTTHKERQDAQERAKVSRKRSSGASTASQRVTGSKGLRSPAKKGPSIGSSKRDTTTTSAQMASQKLQIAATSSGTLSTLSPPPPPASPPLATAKSRSPDKARRLVEKLIASSSPLTSDDEEMAATPEPVQLEKSLTAVTEGDESTEKSEEPMEKDRQEEAEDPMDFWADYQWTTSTPKASPRSVKLSPAQSLSRRALTNSPTNSTFIRRTTSPLASKTASAVSLPPGTQPTPLTPSASKDSATSLLFTQSPVPSASPRKSPTQATHHRLSASPRVPLASLNTISSSPRPRKPVVEDDLTRIRRERMEREAERARKREEARKAREEEERRMEEAMQEAEEEVEEIGDLGNFLTVPIETEETSRRSSVRLRSTSAQSTDGPSARSAPSTAAAQRPRLPTEMNRLIRESKLEAKNGRRIEDDNENMAEARRILSEAPTSEHHQSLYPTPDLSPDRALYANDEVEIGDFDELKAEEVMAGEDVEGGLDALGLDEDMRNSLKKGKSRKKEWEIPLWSGFWSSPDVKSEKEWEPFVPQPPSRHLAEELLAMLGGLPLRDTFARLVTRPGLAMTSNREACGYRLALEVPPITKDGHFSPNEAENVTLILLFWALDTGTSPGLYRALISALRELWPVVMEHTNAINTARSITSLAKDLPLPAQARLLHTIGSYPDEAKEIARWVAVDLLSAGLLDSRTDDKIYLVPDLHALVAASDNIFHQAKGAGPGALDALPHMITMLYEAIDIETLVETMPLPAENESHALSDLSKALSAIRKVVEGIADSNSAVRSDIRIRLSQLKILTGIQLEKAVRRRVRREQRSSLGANLKEGVNGQTKLAFGKLEAQEQ